MRIKMSREIAWGAATDAGNASMKRGGRAGWSEDDYQKAVDTFNRLWPEEREIEEARQAYNAAVQRGTKENESESSNIPGPTM